MSSGGGEGARATNVRKSDESIPNQPHTASVSFASIVLRPGLLPSHFQYQVHHKHIRSIRMSGGVQGTGEEVRLRMAGGVRTKTVCV